MMKERKEKKALFNKSVYQIAVLSFCVCKKTTKFDFHPQVKWEITFTDLNNIKDQSAD